MLGVEGRGGRRMSSSLANLMRGVLHWQHKTNPLLTEWWVGDEGDRWFSYPVGCMVVMNEEQIVENSC